MKPIYLASTALCLALATPALAVEKTDVLDTYSDMAAAKYADSLTSAKVLQTAINALVADPSAENLGAAKEAWLAARVPYQQTEVFRFGNAIVDDWEGKVNAWPLDEGLIDYVDASYGGPTDENAAATLNVIANASFTLSSETVDASTITPALLEETLQEADGVEANVAQLPLRQFGQEHRDAVHIGLSAEEVGLWVGLGSGQQMLPAAEADLELERRGTTIERREINGCAVRVLRPADARHGEVLERGFQMLNLAGAQRVAPAAAVEIAPGGAIGAQRGGGGILAHGPRVYQRRWRGAISRAARSSPRAPISGQSPLRA